MLLVRVLEALEDLDGLGLRRLEYLDLLEPARQRPVFVERLLYIGKRGRPDAAQGPRGQRRLQQVAGVHGPTRGRARADHGVNLVDEQDGVLVLRQRIQHLLDAFLEIAAIARAGHQRAHVEREHANALQRVGHVVLVNAQGQAFGERRLADTRLTHQQRVVLATATQHLDHPLEFELPADQRIDRAVGRLGHQISGERLEWILDASLAAIRRDGAFFLAAVRDGAQQRDAFEALLAQEIGRVAVVLLQQEHQQRPALHLLRARRSRVNDGTFDDAIEAEGGFGLDRLAARHRREGAFEHLLQVRPQGGQVDAARGEEGGRLRVLNQRVQHVLQADQVMTTLGRDAKGAANTLEGVRGERNGCAAHARAPSGSGSSVTSNGYSCCSASCWVALTLVSATSRVNTPATPTPAWWTCIITANASAGGMLKTVSNTQTTNSWVVKSSLCSSTRHRRG